MTSSTLIAPPLATRAEKRRREEASRGPIREARRSRRRRPRRRPRGALGALAARAPAGRLLQL